MYLWNKGFWNYSRRLFVWLVAYSLLLTGCALAFQYRREKQFKVDELNAQLQLINNYIIDELNDGIDVPQIPLHQLHPFDELRVSVIDRDGEIIYDNALDSLPHSNHRGRSEISQAMLTGSGYALRRHSESNGKTYFYSARCGRNGVIVRTAVPYNMSLNEFLEADYGFFWFMGGIMVVMCTIGFFATRRLGHNVQRLNRFAKSVERGERISDVEPFPHDEIGDISNNLVRLYARLQQAQQARDKEHRNALFEQREKERIKKQLTNNINHELKTPVASIQICLETLLTHSNMDESKRREFLERCLANTGRLKSLLADVSLITRMEDGSNSIEKHPLDLTEIISSVCTDFEEEAAAKGITIHNHISNPNKICGNEALLTSIFANLISNAVSYSGGTEINVNCVNADSKELAITIADNGVGVTSEHLPRLFERFYRIDKGRSREAGGTGLGLAIVKNAVALHGGKITVQNRRDGGLIFHFTLAR